MHKPPPFIVILIILAFLAVCAFAQDLFFIDGFTKKPTIHWSMTCFTNVHTDGIEREIGFRDDGVIVWRKWEGKK